MSHDNYWETIRIKLSSGKVIEPNCGYLGISSKRENGCYEISEGYDDELMFTKYESGTGNYIPAFTRDELNELANVMINRWVEFKQQVATGIYTKEGDEE